MQLYKYTRYFKPTETYGIPFTHKFLRSVRRLQDTLTRDPIEPENFTHEYWFIPFDKPLKDEYYNILYIYAKLCGVKLMWRKIITPGLEVEKGLMIIGYEQGVKLWIHIADFYFTQSLNYYIFTKASCKEEAQKANYRDVRTYASHLVVIQRDTIYSFVKDLLATDYVKDLWMEAQIKQLFRLDYKRYNTDHREYYHATSKRFHHKRMLL